MIRKRHGILFLALVTLIGISVFPTGVAGPEASGTAEFGKISGRVVDQLKSEPIAFATIHVDGTTLGAASDSKGNFTVVNVRPGIYNVRASAPGYATTVVTAVIVAADSTTEVELALRPRIASGDSVNVVSSRDIIDLNVTSNKRPVAEAAGPRQSITTFDEVLSQESAIAKQGYQMYARGGRSHQMLRDMDLVPPPLRPRWNTEQYAQVDENGFHSVWKAPLSTFSIDVDAASYSNMRRFLNQGQLPPKDAVRIEEWINYFSYDYPQPDGDVPFSITTEISECPWNARHRLAHIGLQGRRVDTENLPPSNLVFLLDVSGSMNMPNKLPLVKASMRMLVNELRPEDRVAIVVYAGAAGLVLESTPGSHKREILNAIDRLQAGGSTAGGAGIQLAYRVAWNNFIEDGNNRVILATDGDFNVGVSADGELEKLIAEKRETGVFLTVLGFGTGNIKDAKMEILADKGNGNYAYIDNILEGRKVLVTEMGGTLFTIAKDVKIQIEFNPAQVSAYRLIGYENRLLADEDFNDDRKDAGELGSGHTVTALYELIPTGADWPDPAVDPLKYQRPRYEMESTLAHETMTVKLRYKEPDGQTSKLIQRSVVDLGMPLHVSSDNFRFSAAVAQFGMLLRNSRFASEVSFGEVMDLAAGAKGADPQGYRGEFIRLVSLAEALRESIARR